MSAKEIKDLRKAGKFEEAYALAKAEYEQLCTDNNSPEVDANDWKNIEGTILNIHKIPSLEYERRGIKDGKSVFVRFSFGKNGNSWVLEHNYTNDQGILFPNVSVKVALDELLTGKNPESLTAQTLVRKRNDGSSNQDEKLLWAKRNLSWPIYDLLKANCKPEGYPTFKKYLEELVALNLPESETMLTEHLAWLIGKLVFHLPLERSNDNSDTKTVFISFPSKVFDLFLLSKNFTYPKPSEAYSFLFKAFHKALKDWKQYLELADWWSFENFREEDFKSERFEGREIMAIAEQAYISYAKHLLNSEEEKKHEKIKNFIPRLDVIIAAHPEYLYPPYYKAKLLLLSGASEDVLKTLLPFARRKMNDFWVWEVLSETTKDQDLILSCYCRALLCKVPDEFLVKLRQRLASLLISKKLYEEAKTEIERVIAVRTEKGWKIPEEVSKWIKEQWYKATEAPKDNLLFYKKHEDQAEGLLFQDYPEDLIVVEYVNEQKKILNFVGLNEHHGYLSYRSFNIKPEVGEILSVRFKGNKSDGLHQTYTIRQEENELSLKELTQKVTGRVKIPTGKPFGFVENIFIHPATIRSLKLQDGMEITGTAIKSYNQEKQNWGWKLVKIKANLT